MVRRMAGPVKHVGKHGGQGGLLRRNARAAAIDIVARLSTSGETRASELLATGLMGLSDVRDRHLATELVYGVMRWRRRLEHTLAPLVSRGLGSLEPLALAALLVGAYQIRFLDRIPREVAVSATQDAARSMGLSRVTGLINAVLRKVVSTPEVLPSGHSVAEIGLRTSLPDWIVRALVERYGEAAETEALALRERASVTLRPTLGRGGLQGALAALTAEGFAVSALPQPGPWVSSEMILVGSGDVFSSRAFAEGRFCAQDPASLAVVDILGRSLPGATLEGARVLDLCAGRGIKATALMDRGAKVVAVDVASHKLGELERLARLLGVEGRLERVLATDAAAEASAPVLEGLGDFAAVLIDAPCTGVGTLRRHPELAWRRRAEDVEALASLQEKLVEVGARRVAPGGILVYAVCSFVGREAAVSLPSGFRAAARVDVPPSSGLDAFQVLVLERSTP